MPYDIDHRGELDGTARDFLEDVLLTAYRTKAPDTVVPADPGMPLIESKSERADVPMDRILRDYVARAVKISKYCAAVALLHPRMRANPWRPAMRAFFDGRGPFTGPPGQDR